MGSLDNATDSTGMSAYTLRAPASVRDRRLNCVQEADREVHDVSL